MIFIFQHMPPGAAAAVGRGLGDVLHGALGRRRALAAENLRRAFPEKDEAEVRGLVRESFRSMVLTLMEMIRLRSFLTDSEAVNALRESSADLDALFAKAREIHDRSGGCIFVTPHIGNWEVLPFVSRVMGIPLVVVGRPLDNPYLQRLLFSSRTESGQLVIPKRNALFVLQRTLSQGKSIGLLPDQSTKKGIVVDFFGRPATTTPLPALLAVTYRRPIVVVACCRKETGSRYFKGYVSDPLWPRPSDSERAEIERLTAEMTRAMEEIIRLHPEQYFWVHNRWKRYD